LIAAIGRGYNCWTWGGASGKLHLSFCVFLHLIAEIRSDKT
jgi:hypothetical protein